MLVTVKYKGDIYTLRQMADLFSTSVASIHIIYNECDHDGDAMCVYIEKMRTMEWFLCGKTQTEIAAKHKVSVDVLTSIVQDAKAHNKDVSVAQCTAIVLDKIKEHKKSNRSKTTKRIRLVEWFGRKLTKKQIAKIYDIPVAVVYKYFSECDNNDAVLEKILNRYKKAKRYKKYKNIEYKKYDKRNPPKTNLPIKLYSKKLTKAEIADKYNVSYQSVCYYMQKYSTAEEALQKIQNRRANDEKRKKSGFKPREKNSLVDWFGEALTKKQIAEKYDIPTHAVYVYFRRCDNNDAVLEKIKARVVSGGPQTIIEWFGEKLTRHEIAKRYGIPYSAVCTYLRKCTTVDDVLNKIKKYKCPNKSVKCVVDTLEDVPNYVTPSYVSPSYIPANPPEYCGYDGRMEALLRIIRDELDYPYDEYSMYEGEYDAYGNEYEDDNTQTVRELDFDKDMHF